jgi:hypothetical protein
MDNALFFSDSFSVSWYWTLMLRSIYDCQIGWWTSTILISLAEFFRPFFAPARHFYVRFGKIQSYCVAHVANKTTEKKNTQKTPSDGNCSSMIICLFVYRYFCQQNHSLKPPKKNKYTKDTIWWELFVNDHLFICVSVFSPTKSQPKLY